MSGVDRLMADAGGYRAAKEEARMLKRLLWAALHAGPITIPLLELDAAPETSALQVYENHATRTLVVARGV